MINENGRSGKDFLQKAVEGVKSQKAPVILQLEVYKDGSVSLQSALPPQEVVKILNNTAIATMCEMFEPKAISKIEKPL